MVRRELEEGKLPNINRLLNGGGALNRCLSIFPSITPAATCSIATGCYPAEHEIEGACWFDRERAEIAYFGDDLRFTLERGLQDFFVDFADHLNFELLACPTLFETLDMQNVDSACVNFMWFAGPHVHQRHTPFLLRALAGKLREKVCGPKFLKIGEFVEALPEGVEKGKSHSILTRYGFKDESTADIILKLAAADSLPPLTLGYFPNNDFQSHKKGPSESAKIVLEPFDEFLGDLVEKLGGWECIGKDVEILIVGDHSQTEFPSTGPNPIRIDQCLSQFQQADPGSGWKDGDEIFVCPNMRSAAIYIRDLPSEDLQRRIVQRLLAEPQIDQVIFENVEGFRHVHTSDRGCFSFCRSSEANVENAKDDFGNAWHIEGDLKAVDASVDSEGRLIEGDYPNPLERIDGAFVEGSFPIWVTARKDSEFRVDETSTHSGGSHGALNMDDSESALITSSGVPLHLLTNASRPRIVDVAPLCHHVLGVPRKKASIRADKQLSLAADNSSGIK